MRKSLKTVFSRTKGKNGAYDKSVVHRLRGAAFDIQFKNFGTAQDQLIDILKRRDEIADPGLVRIALQHLGATYYLQDRYEEGIEFFSSYAMRYPADADAYSQRATMLWYSDKHQDAVEDFSRAIELFPHDFFALSGRGQALVDLGQYERGLRDLDLASKSLDQYLTLDLLWRRRNQAYLQGARASAFAGLGEFDRALEEFESSITLSPNNAWVYYRRARAYEALGEQAKAASDYRLALDKNDPKLSLAKAQYSDARLRGLAMT